MKRLCALVDMLDIERCSFCAWRATAPARAAADAALAQRIRQVHAEDNTYGAPGITAELNNDVPTQRRVNHKRVARAMREYGIRSDRRRRAVRTTIPDQANATVPDLLGRDITAASPSQVYVGDITYPRWPTAATSTWPP